MQSQEGRRSEQRATGMMSMASTPHGLIFCVQGDGTFGAFLFALTGGQLQPLGGSLARFAVERLLALADGGAVVTSSRHFSHGPREGEARTIRRVQRDEELHASSRSPRASAPVQSAG